MSHGSVPEMWSRTELADWQGARLSELLKVTVPANPFWARKLADAGVDPNSIHTPDDLKLLPFTTKAELVEDQLAHSPYGTNLTFPVVDYSRLHQTSGTTTGRPLRWLDTPASWTAGQRFIDCWACGELIGCAFLFHSVRFLAFGQVSKERLDKATFASQQVA